MRILGRLARCVPLLVLANAVWFWRAEGSPAVKIIVLAAAGLLALAVHIKPCRADREATRRLRLLRGGYELLYLYALCFAGECVFWVRTFAPASLGWWGNAACALLILFPLLLHGCVRIFLVSAQLGVVWRFLLLVFWWLPGVNLYLVMRAGAIARREYRFELAKLELNAARAESEVCRTRYPILLVHGIFFRDWMLFNYWGRIPRELQKNGAQVYYGKQQSAGAVARSAEELCAQITRIVETTGCGKVNIIAHSKGGLDARCAISRYGMDKYVASLTTVNTPHRGCNFADLLLRLLPKGLVRFVAGRYNALFQKLGDTDPDFYRGVLDLTAESCARFNREVPDAPGVYYQSVMSQMRGFASAIFPMNLCYLLIKRLDGANDGLVSVDSAVWGAYRGLVEAKHRKGVSHGDVVDLLRENLPGFDVREYYVQLVHDLKTRGL